MTNAELLTRVYAALYLAKLTREQQHRTDWTLDKVYATTLATNSQLIDELEELVRCVREQGS